MQKRVVKRSDMLREIALGFVGAIIVAACSAPPVGSECSVSMAEPPPVEEPAGSCVMPADEPCMRYRIQLDGDVTDPVIRAKYIAKFGSACYVSEANTFDCFYKDPYDACDAAVLVPDVIGLPAHDAKYPCLKVPGTEDYWRQVGLDQAIKLDIKLEKAPRETPLIDVNGVPTEVNGPYRNLPEPQTVKVGEDYYCPSGMVDAKGQALNQRAYILEVNKKAHGGEIHSDLAGFTWQCKDKCGQFKTCTEELVLNITKNDPNQAQVHHEVRRKDLRGCFWGTNSNRNAVVISARLNQHLRNTYPSAKEVLDVNKVPPYQP
jgi:hypothetical protein